MSYKIAVATSDGKVVNMHFGRADTFYILKIDDNKEYEVVEIRKHSPVCQGGNHDDGALEESANALADCSYILVSRIGAAAENVLAKKGIAVYSIPDLIEDAVKKLISFVAVDELINSFGKS